MYKKLFISIFIIFHLTSIIIWNLNVGFNIPDKAIDIFKPYMYGLSIWQAWNIFSPNPSTKETSTRIVIDTDNETIPHLNKYVKERMPFLFTRLRKFNDNIIANKDINLNTAYLIYLCKEFSKLYDPEFEITLEIMYKDINFPKKDIDSTVEYEKIEDIRCR